MNCPHKKINTGLQIQTLFVSIKSLICLERISNYFHESSQTTSAIKLKREVVLLHDNKQIHEKVKSVLMTILRTEIKKLHKSLTMVSF